MNDNDIKGYYIFSFQGEAVEQESIMFSPEDLTIAKEFLERERTDYPQIHFELLALL